MNDQFIQKVNIDWDKIDDSNYLRNIPAIKSLNSLELSNPVTFFVGENGSGKSTLLEAILTGKAF